MNIEKIITDQAAQDLWDWLHHHPVYSEHIVCEVASGGSGEIWASDAYFADMFYNLPINSQLHTTIEWLDEIGFYINISREDVDGKPFYMWQLTRDDGFSSTSGEMNKAEAILSAVKKANEYYNYFKKLESDGLNNSTS